MASFIRRIQRTVDEHAMTSRFGCRPSLQTKAAIQAAYSLDVGNLRDTGHLAEATPPAASAEKQKCKAN